MDNHEKTKNFNKGIVTTLFTLSLLFFLFFTSLIQVSAQPTGVTVSSNITSLTGFADPSNRTDPGGSITTLVLDVLQPNPRWKAYVGNMTGVLSLDDADGHTIFQWDLGGSVDGELYVSRNNDLTWTSVRCANVTEIEAEDSVLGLVSTRTDTINKTYNETSHPEIQIGSLAPIAENTCRSMSTYVANIPQVTPDFPALLLASESKLVYVTPINQGMESYRAGSFVDFQLILANDPTSTTTYYFYAEIGGS